MIPVHFAPEAATELSDAAAWYMLQRPGLELVFLADAERVLPLISAAPASFRRLLDVPEDLMIRRALLRRFPYGLVFMQQDAAITILAVAHLKRRPGYWLGRLML